MKENNNKHEVLLSTEQWLKIEQLLNGVKLTPKQQRIYSDVRRHMAKYNKPHSRIRCAEEKAWAEMRAGVSVLLKRLFQPPFNGCLDVYVPSRVNDWVKCERLIIIGAYQETRRTHVAKDPETGIEYLSKPAPTIYYRIKDTIMCYQIDPMVLHQYIVHKLNETPHNDFVKFCIEQDFTGQDKRLGV